MNNHDKWSSEEVELAMTRIKVCTISNKAGDAFADVLDALLAEGQYDLVIIDPAFAYLGGDSNKQADVSHFMRERLISLVQKHNVGLILAHHTNKPPRGKEKEGYAAGDFAYLGAGSAEWVNAARSALAIRSLGSDNVFELRAVKRGKRLGWADEDGVATTVQHIAHDDRPGVICWRAATDDEITEVTIAKTAGRPKKYSLVECVHAVANQPGAQLAVYVDLLASKLGCGKSTARRLLKDSYKGGWLKARLVAGKNVYDVTEDGRAHAKMCPSAYQWAA